MAEGEERVLNECVRDVLPEGRGGCTREEGARVAFQALRDSRVKA